ncbi:MAG: glycosyltransferase, partial [bacterium]
SNRISTASKIPRYIHVCWFGGFDQPKLFKQWQDEWKAMHPGWTFMLWNENSIKQEFPGGLFNQSIYTEAEDMYDYATMSKIVRYEILNKYGGLYIDPDIQCFESFTPLHKEYDFYCGLGHFDTYGCINNGIFGSRPCHPILKACMDYIKNCETFVGGFYEWTSKNLGHQMFTLCVYNNINQKSNVDIIFPATFFDGNNVEMEFNHSEEPVQAAYTHLASQPESFCARGIYSYNTGVSQLNVAM